MGGDSYDNADGLITLHAQADRAACLAGVANKVHVLVEVTTGEKAREVERPAFDLALVLDKSGSMSGSKLEKAKQAAKFVVDNIGPRDRLALVLYDTDVSVCFGFEDGHNKNKASLHQRIDAIRSGSCTNIGGGLERAYEMLVAQREARRRNGNATTTTSTTTSATTTSDTTSDTTTTTTTNNNTNTTNSNHLSRIFLFSDGLVNAGKHRDADSLGKLVDGFHDDGVTTSAYGIGDDFDENMMQLLAEYGRADFAFVDEPANIPKYIRKGLRGLLTLIGTNASLCGRGSNGVVVKDILGHDDAVRGAQLGDLRESNHVNVVFELEVAPTEGHAAPLFTYELTFKADGAGAAGPGAAFTSVTGSIQFACTTDRDAALAAPEGGAAKVEIALGILRASKADEECIALLDAGRVDDAISTKAAMLASLAQYEAADTTGFVASIVKRGGKTLTEMKKKDNVKKMRKYCHHEMAMERAMSAGSLNYDVDDDVFED